MAGNVMEYSLRFTADTAQAKAQIRDLTNSLNQLSSQAMNRPVSFDGTIANIQRAGQAASQLKVLIQDATNAKTGTLDLGAFQTSLSKAGMTLKQYRDQLVQLGPAGQQAFMQVAKSIAMAEMPLARTNVLMTKFATTLANTARWQLSSMMIRGFTSGISEAMRYAQDLNKSLTNIRIVTEYSTKDMAKFAVEANKAARALSMTTTAYTDASLIFYQQGLRGEDVTQRSEVVSKMAAVTGQTAQIVSDQMTAVWNNFYDGSKSLEFYADAMTKLGAATASSTDEIAQGLEKFAAIADTVGLSYETATAALATVTAETRQSADVVGTAFKTIFARMEGLKLGETLEDGVGLNKYSEALSAVGVDIIDKQTNQIKEMDDILEETGAKWQTIGKEQQIALAQTVAGIRQYSQFMALMDNWDKVQNNIRLAASSTGELNEQFSDYEESWAASANRVKTAWQSIIDNLVDEDFFIGFNDGLANTLDLVGALVKAFGGLPGILSMVSTLMFNTFGDKMSTALGNTLANMYKLSATGQNAFAKMKQDALNLAMEGVQGEVNKASDGQLTGLTKQKAILEKMIDQKNKLTQLEQAQYQELLKNTEEMTEQLIISGQQADAAQRAIDSKTSSGHNLMQMHGASEQDMRDYNRAFVSRNKYAQKVEQGTQASDIMANVPSFKDDGSVANVEKYIDAIQRLKNIYGELNSDQLKNLGLGFLKEDSEINNTISKLDELQKEFNEGAMSADEYEKQYKELLEALKNKVNLGDAYKKQKSSIDGQISKNTKNLNERNKQLMDIEKKVVGNDYNADNRRQEINRDTENIKENTRTIMDNNEKRALASKAPTGIPKNSPKDYEYATQQMQQFGRGIIQIGSAISQTAMVFTSISGIIRTIGDDSTSTKDKIMAIIPSIGMLASSIPMMVASWGTMLTTMKAVNKETVYKLMLDKLSSKGLGKLILSIMGVTVAESGELKAKKKSTDQTKKWSIANTIATSTGWALFAVIAATVAIMAILALVIWGIVKAYDAWKASTPEEQLKKANQQVEAMTENLQRATEEADALRQTIEGYDSAIDKLEKLTKGTVEYKDAVLEANKLAMDLIEKGGLTSEDYYVDDYGLIKINQGAKIKAQEAAYNDKLNAEWALNDAKRAQNQSSQEAFIKRMSENKLYNVYGSNSGKDDYFTYQDSIENDPILGGGKYKVTVSNGVVTSDGAGNWITNDEYEALVLEKIGKIFEERGNSIFEENEFYNLLTNELKINDSNLIKTLNEHRKEIQNNLEENKNNTDAIKANTSALINQEYGELAEKYGTGTVAGARENLIQKNISNYNNSGKAATDYYKGILAGGNNVQNIKDDKEIEKLAAAFNLSKEDIIGGELKFSGNRVFLNKNKDDENPEYVFSGTVEEFNKIMKSAEITEYDLEGELSTSEGYQAAMNTAAGMGYTDAETRVVSKTGHDWSGTVGMTNETAKLVEKQMVTKGEDGWQQAAGEGYDIISKHISEYLNGVDEAVKESVGKELLKKDTNDLKKMITGPGGLKTAMGEIEKNAKIDQLATKFGLTKTQVQKMTDEVIKNNSALKENAIEAAKVVEAQLDMEKKYADLKTSYDELSEKLTSSNLQERTTAFSDLASSLDTFFGVTEAFDADWVEANINTITGAIEGNVAKQKELQKIAGKQILIKMVGEADFGEIEDEYNALINNIPSDIKIGTKIDTGPFLNACNTLITQAKMTQDQVNTYFGNLGFDVEVDMKKIPISVNDVGAYEAAGHNVFYESTWKTSPTTQGTTLITSSENKSKPYIRMPTIKTITPTGEGFGGDTFFKDDDDKGGSSSKPKYPKKSDTVDIYRDENKAIDDLTKALDRLAKAKDKAFGGNYLRILQAEIDANNKLITQYNNKATIARNELSVAIERAKAMGFAVDSSGNISNYEEIMNPLYDQQLANFNAGKEDKELNQKISDAKEVVGEVDTLVSEIQSFEDSVWQTQIAIADLKLDKQLKPFEEAVEKFEEAIKDFDSLAGMFNEELGGNILEYFNKGKIQSENDKLFIDQVLSKSTAKEVDTLWKALNDKGAIFEKEDIWAVAEPDKWKDDPLYIEYLAALQKHDEVSENDSENFANFISQKIKDSNTFEDLDQKSWYRDQSRTSLENYLEDSYGQNYLNGITSLIDLGREESIDLMERVNRNKNTYASTKSTIANSNILTEDEQRRLSAWRDSSSIELIDGNIVNDILNRLDSEIKGTTNAEERTALKHQRDEIMGWIAQNNAAVENIVQGMQDKEEQDRENRSKELERITNSVEYVVECENRQIALLEWEQEWLQRNPYSQANQASNLWSQANLQKSNYDAAKAGFDAIVAGYLAENRGPTAEEKAQMENFYNTMQESTQNILTIQDSFLELVPSVLEEISGVFDKFTSQLEGMTNKLSSMENILGLLGIEDSGLNQLIRDAQFELGNAGVDNAAKKFETLKSNYSDLEKDYQKALKQGDEASQKILKDQLDNTKAMIIEAENDMWTKISELITQVTEDFKEHMEDMMRTSNEALDEMSDKFKKNSDLRNQYLTDTQKVYELSKLSRQLEADISNMDDINSKMALKEILEEINALQADGNKMSKFDLDILKAEYEVEKARIALEDAQQAKNTMRLVRNANGGYSYAYTANQTEIDKAQQTYEDKVYNLQKLMEDYLEQIGKTRIEIQKGLNDELAKLDPNDEEFEEKFQRIIDYWTEKFNYNTDEMSKVMEMLGVDYEDTSYGMITNNSSLEEDTKQFASTIKFYTQEASTAWETWNERTNIAIDDVADNTKDLAENVEDYTGDIGGYIIDLQEETEEPLAKLNNQLGLLSDMVASWFTNSNFAEGLNTMYNGLDNIAKVLKELDGASLPDLSTLNDPAKGKIVNHIVYLKGVWTEANNAENEAMKQWAAEQAIPWYEMLEELDPKLADDLKRADYEKSQEIYQSFNTGGYTGEWGSEGKVAMLHQKELVLNASDTQNILDTVQLVRSIGQNLIASALPKEFLTNFVRTAGNTIGTSEEIFQQDVQINANFPNVSSREEIEQAFNSLAQKAAQYANRKNL